MLFEVLNEKCEKKIKKLIEKYDNEKSQLLFSPKETHIAIQQKQVNASIQEENQPFQQTLNVKIYF
jgi:hypothetical protein